MACTLQIADAGFSGGDSFSQVREAEFRMQPPSKKKKKKKNPGKHPVAGLSKGATLHCDNMAVNKAQHNGILEVGNYG